MTTNEGNPTSKLHPALVGTLLILSFFSLMNPGATIWAGENRYGIYQVLHYGERANDPTTNIHSPYLAGVVLTYNWAELEPEEGKFRWDLIDEPMSEWAKEGKRVILCFKAVQKKGINPTQGCATPPWVFESGARHFQNDQTIWPIYWDKIYLEKYEAFLKSAAARYDGNPTIEFIVMGVGQFGTTKISGPRKILREYRRYGYSDPVWSDTIRRIIDTHCNYFKKTPLALGLSPFMKYGDGSERIINPIAEYAAEKGIYLYNHSLKGTAEFAENPFLPLYGKLYQKTKIVLGVDNPVSGYRQKYGNIHDVVENAFGGVNGVPVTHISYLTLYEMDISAATKGSPKYDETFETAIKLAYERLRSANENGKKK
jgi:hypothetical protein